MLGFRIFIEALFDATIAGLLLLLKNTKGMFITIAQNITANTMPSGLKKKL